MSSVSWENTINPINTRVLGQKNETTDVQPLNTTPAVTSSQDTSADNSALINLPPGADAIASVLHPDVLKTMTSANTSTDGASSLSTLDVSSSSTDSSASTSEADASKADSSSSTSGADDNSTSSPGVTGPSPTAPSGPAQAPGTTLEVISPDKIKTTLENATVVSMIGSSTHRTFRDSLIPNHPDVVFVNIGPNNSNFGQTIQSNATTNGPSVNYGAGFKKSGSNYIEAEGTQWLPVYRDPSNPVIVRIEDSTDPNNKLINYTSLAVNDPRLPEPDKTKGLDPEAPAKPDTPVIPNFTTLKNDILGALKEKNIQADPEGNYIVNPVPGADGRIKISTSDQYDETVVTFNREGSPGGSFYYIFRNSDGVLLNKGADRSFDRGSPDVMLGIPGLEEIPDKVEQSVTMLKALAQHIRSQPPVGSK